MSTIQTSIIKDKIERMRDRYNPENDTIPGAPSVTWADDQLVDMIEKLVIAVEHLQGIVDGIGYREAYRK